MFFFYNSSQANSKDKKNSSSDKNIPTRIRSDIIDIKRKSQTIDFIGNVVVEKGDDSMLSQKMTVFYDQPKKDKKPAESVEAGESQGTVKSEEVKSEENTALPKGSSIKRIDAKENVKIFSQEFIATGDSGYYDPKESVFILEKNVIVNNGTSIASGDKFVYNLKTKKSNFVGEKKEAGISAGKASEKIISEDGKDKRVIVVIGNDLKKQKKSEKDDNLQDESLEINNSTENNLKNTDQ